MFDIGGWEILIIAVVGLIVIGPERLPDVARTVGRWVGRIRRFIVNVKSDIDREIQQEELKKAIERDAGLDEIKQIMNTERFSLEEEEPSEKFPGADYQVKAIDDNKAEKHLDKEEDSDDWENEITSNESGHYDAADMDYDSMEDEITSNETGHSDAADMDYETIEKENTAAKDK